MANHTGSREDGRVYVAPPPDSPPDDPDGPPVGPQPPPQPPPSTSRKSVKRERRRLRKSSRDSKILALIRGRPKKYTLPLHQAYSHLHYDKIEHIIDEAWNEHVDGLKRSNTAYENLSAAQVAEVAKDERLKVVNRELRRLYNAESDKIKSEVQEYRTKYSVEFDSMSAAEKQTK